MRGVLRFFISAPKKVNRGNLQDVCVDTLVLVEASRVLAPLVGGKASTSDFNFEALGLKSCQEVRSSRLANVY